MCSTNGINAHPWALALSSSQAAFEKQLQIAKALNLPDSYISEIDKRVAMGFQNSYDFFMEVLSKFIGTGGKLNELGRVLRKLNLPDVIDKLGLNSSSEPGLRFDVPPCSKFFIGRNADLNMIHEILTQDNFETATKHHLCITGESGIGKTALAAKYAELNSAYYNDTLIFINGENEDTFSRGIRRLAGDPKFKNVRSEGSQLKTLIEEICKTLPKRWLLVLDNSTNDAVLNDFPTTIDPKVHRPHVLITSKGIKPSPQSVNVINRQPLEGLPSEEAEDLVKKSLRKNSEEILCRLKELVARFNGHPRNLLQAVHYINEKLIHNEARPIVRYLETNEKEILKYNKRLEKI